MSPSLIVSVGATYALGSIKGGSLAIDRLGTLNIKAKNAYSVYVEPGLLINDRTLAYAKLSYEGAQGLLTFTDGTEEHKSIKGTGIGIGIRTMVNKTSFIQAEFRQVGYRSNSIREIGSFKPKATIGTIGFGVMF